MPSSTYAHISALALLCVISFFTFCARAFRGRFCCFCFVLFCFVLFCFVLFCFVLFFFVWNVCSYSLCFVCDFVLRCVVRACVRTVSVCFPLFFFCSARARCASVYVVIFSLRARARYACVCVFLIFFWPRSRALLCTPVLVHIVNNRNYVCKLIIVLISNYFFLNSSNSSTVTILHTETNWY